MKKNLIIFTDSGDTIIDESTQVFDDRGIVTKADFIPGADKVLVDLYNEGYRIALVADGEVESFDNVYRENGLGYCFEERIISEAVGEQKPAKSMFDTAMTKMKLTDADRPFIVMIGNNIKKDVAGANRYGLISIWLDWSPRYFHTYEETDWIPDYVVKTPEELKKLIEELEKKAELQKSNIEKIDQKMQAMIGAFSDILYTPDAKFMENMKTKCLAGDDIKRYEFWEWTQGVGLYGLWKLFQYQKDEKYVDILRNYYDRQLGVGFPALNVNTVTPYLAMSCLAEYTGEEKYMQPCIEAANAIMEKFPRTKEGGFQHMTSDTLNAEELWDDTLFMTVLFLANMGRILKDVAMTEEAKFQFLIHEKYLSDKKTGMWYHGWTFNGNNNFAEAFWGRGNCWITMAIPEFFAITGIDGAEQRILRNAFAAQADSLKKYQVADGMWRTLVDDETAYEESSATSGFAYGLIKGVKEKMVDKSYLKLADKAFNAIMDCISDEGVVSQVSYGTPMGRESKEFYKTIPLMPMPYGQALAMLFLMEYKSILM